MLGVNLWGVIHGVHAFLPILKGNREGGHIVNTASMAGLVAGPRLGAYAAAKYGVVGLTEVLAAELAADGSRVGASVLCPGTVHTSIGTSSRNRPADLPDAGSRTSTSNSKTTPGTGGSTPQEAGAVVVRAIKRGDLYALTHPDWYPHGRRAARGHRRRVPGAGGRGGARRGPRQMKELTIASIEALAGLRSAAQGRHPGPRLLSPSGTVVVKVTTASGLTGDGASPTTAGHPWRWRLTVNTTLRDLLTGLDAAATTAVWDVFRAPGTRQPRHLRRLHLRHRGAIDMALWDVVGKASWRCRSTAARRVRPGGARLRRRLRARLRRARVQSPARRSARSPRGYRARQAAARRHARIGGYRTGAVALRSALGRDVALLADANCPVLGRRRARDRCRCWPRPGRAGSRSRSRRTRTGHGARRRASPPGAAAGGGREPATPGTSSSG